MKNVLLTLPFLLLSFAAKASANSEKTIPVSCSFTLFDISDSTSNWVDKVFDLNEIPPGGDHFKNGVVLARGKNVLIGLIRSVNSPNELVIEILQSKSVISPDIENSNRYLNEREYENLSRPFVAAGESIVGATGTVGSEGFTVRCNIKK